MLLVVSTVGLPRPSDFFFVIIFPHVKDKRRSPTCFLFLSCVTTSVTDHWLDGYQNSTSNNSTRCSQKHFYWTSFFESVACLVTNSSRRMQAEFFKNQFTTSIERLNSLKKTKTKRNNSEWSNKFRLVDIYTRLCLTWHRYLNPDGNAVTAFHDRYRLPSIQPLS